MTVIRITLLLVFLCLPQVLSYTLSTMKTSILSSSQNTLDSSKTELDFYTSTENSPTKAYSLHNSGDLNEEITAVDSTSAVTMILKTPVGDISTWKSMIEFEEAKVSKRENITTTENQRTTVKIDLVEEATATAKVSSELTTGHIDLVEEATATAKVSSELTTGHIDLVEEATATAKVSYEPTTEHIDLVEEATATAKVSYEPTTEYIDLVEEATATPKVSYEPTREHIDLVEEATAPANRSSEPTTENQATTKHIDLVESVTASANGSSKLATISSDQSLITSSAFNNSHMGEVDSDMTLETTMIYRTESPSEKPSTYSSMGPCLMAIFILAFLATLFIVCTIVLFTKLTFRKKDHRLHQENSTEMMCISTLLQDNEPAAEQSKVKPKRMKTFGSNAHDSDEDNMTLNSFMPDH
uniref:P-selectin glycoprotein ligand 1 n=1 Tax=Geotrypetes seraphini TaxID=260995 RepID=A0A6P8S2J2_GEOSA|nr:P-selectin glycoprotein ligand 1 [Geotrypetes seraphini]XP_033812024.1 P-selectin glycoprotein ligand 1 [Geotrypetes seraphini]